MISFVNSLDPDQDRQSGSKLFDADSVPEIIFEKVNLAASSSQFSTSPVEESTGEDCCCFKPY